MMLFLFFCLYGHSRSECSLPKGGRKKWITISVETGFSGGLNISIFRLRFLKGHCKTGHTGSLQKRPWEGSRNLDVVPFRSLFGQV
jgi:hypothetical protein